jgi:hypothetical protein
MSHPPFSTLKRACLTSSAAIALSTLSAFGQAELIVTELHYNPSDTLGDTADFIEIKNVGNATANVSGYTISAVDTPISYTQTTIAPGSFLVLTASAPAFQAKYGFAAGGTFTGGFAGSGENVKIESGATEIFAFRYWDGKDNDPVVVGEEDRGNWPEMPDGTGFTLVSADPNGNNDPDDYRNWRRSINKFGSPGADEPLPNPVKEVLLNEVRTRDGVNANDAIELYNPGLADIDISGWFLTDNGDTPEKIILPPGTIISAGGYLTVVNGVNTMNLSLSSKGERAFIYSGNGTVPTGYVNGFYFNGSSDGVNFGRYINSDGIAQYPAMLSTLGSANGLPFVSPVVITEIMYNPGGATGGTDEFIEIKNTSNQTVLLYDPAHPGTNWRVEGINFTLNGVQPSLAAGEIALIVPTNPTTFRTNHGVPAGIKIFGPYGAGVSPPSLRDKGEIVALQRPELIDAEQIYIDVDVVDYDNGGAWPTSAAGGGRSLERIDPLLYGNESANWSSSLELKGSPGVILNYTGPEIYVNEILAHTDFPQVDAIEFYNPNATAVNIGDWWLSDSRDAPKKFRIPTGTMIPAMGYWVINGDNDANNLTTPPSTYFASQFSLSENGESVVLSSAGTSGVLTGFQQNIDFPGTDNGVSVGRVIDSQGRVAFVPLNSITFTINRTIPNPTGMVNSAAKIGPVVISEIRYNPAGAEPEFIELTNITGSVVALYDSVNTNNTWLFSSGVSFSFPSNFPTIPANGRIIILPQGTSGAAFRSLYSIPAAVVIYGDALGFTGSLSNEGEKVVLSKKGPPNADEGNAAPVITVDYVDYGVTAPWPVLSGGGGRSIERIDLSSFGGEAMNWKTSNIFGGSPGAANSVGTVYEVWKLSMFTQQEIDFGGTAATEDFNGDGYSNLLAYVFGFNPHNQPTAEQLPQAVIVDDSSEAYLALSILRNKAANDLTISAELSSDLVNWGGSGVAVGAPVDNNDGTETIILRDPNPVGSSPKLFLRGKVTLN